MQITKNKAFTLVELLVVITILAIISVVAYQNFGGAVDKAVSGRKISDVSTIETALQQYKADNNFFPKTDIYSANNLWGYKDVPAKASNTLEVEYDGQAIQTLTGTTVGGGNVLASGSTVNIGYKGTISQKTLGKRYLTKDLYDPELGDLAIKKDNKKMVDFGIGRYVYAIYKKGPNKNKRGVDYNVAYTIKKPNSDIYLTRISGSYDSESCYGDPTDCPDTLIGPSINNTLTEGSEQDASKLTTNTNQGIPYPVTDFAGN